MILAGKIGKNALVYIGTFLVGFLLHTCVFAHLPLGVVTPNVMLVITASMGLMYGDMVGMVFGLCYGIVIDSFGASYFGTNTLIYLLLGYLNGRFKRFYFGGDLRLPLIFLTFSELIYGSLIYIFSFLVRQRFNPGFYYLNIIIPETIYSLLILVLLYYPLNKTLKWIK